MLFSVLPGTTVPVSLPVEQVHFVDVSWLEACASSQSHLPEEDFQRHQTNRMKERKTV